MLTIIDAIIQWCLTSITVLIQWMLHHYSVDVDHFWQLQPPFTPRSPAALPGAGFPKAGTGEGGGLGLGKSPRHTWGKERTKNWHIYIYIYVYIYICIYGTNILHIWPSMFICLVGTIRNHHDKWIYKKMGLKHLSLGAFVDTKAILKLIKWIMVTPPSEECRTSSICHYFRIKVSWILSGGRTIWDATLQPANLAIGFLKIKIRANLWWDYPDNWDCQSKTVCWFQKMSLQNQIL